MANLYDILGVDIDADLSVIKSAYRKLSKKFHPDLNPDDAFFERMFLKIQQAYEILSDSELREKYNQTIFSTHFTEQNIQQNHDKFPTIKNFSTDKNSVKVKEIFTITWQVENADQIEIKPFGKFPLKGVESFKFNHFKQPQINIVLIALNSETGASARDFITIHNASYNSGFTIINDKWLSYIILVGKIIILILILAFILAIIFLGIEVQDPVESLYNK